MDVLRSAFVFLIVACRTVAVCAADSPPGTIDFNRDVRPILSNKCFACHGPDQGRLQAGLRLDDPQSAMAELDSGSIAVMAGKPDASEVIVRVTSDDDSMKMPPVDSGKSISAAEVDILRRWIVEGAPFAKHWSYVVPQRPQLPPIDTRFSDWPINAIDHFALRAMIEHDLAPSPAADRYAMIRRVSLDVTGLPPSVEQADAFVRNDDPPAYDRLVDSLLADPAFGEHWARKWLDLARYADSAGYADDPSRTIWAYRDWVIRALNANMPFDEFTRQQLAGDLLTNSSQERLIATAFHRNTLTNNEGGTQDEEFRNVAVVDRVNTTMAVWMGTTMACAQCHNHKYDPISQEEYFRFFAILNNTADADRRDESPLVDVYSEEQQEQIAELDTTIRKLSNQLDEMTPELDTEQMRWENALQRDTQWKVVAPASAVRTSGKEIDVEPQGTVLVTSSAEKDDYDLEFPCVVERLAALRIRTLPADTLPGRGSGLGGGNFVITRIRVHEIAGDKSRELPLDRVVADYHQQGFEPEDVLRGGKGNEDGWAVGGQIDKPHELLIVPATPIARSESKRLRLTIEHQSPHKDHLLARFQIEQTEDATAVDKVRMPNELLKMIRQSRSGRSDDQVALVSHYFRHEVAESLLPVRRALLAAKADRDSIKPMTTVPVMQELTGEHRTTHLQHRGNYLDIGPEVTAGLPAVFCEECAAGSAAGGDADRPVDRMALANWLVSDRNPLTARVQVNRIWEALFGQGLVVTSEEFGSQGELPTHPELLDWLACEYISSGWDTKALIRLIVTSATYRQCVVVNSPLLQADPANRWLARGPRVRLSAEMVRDQALACAGLLSRKMYGPPVRPPQPEMGLKAAFGSDTDWRASDGEDRYRRGIYTTWRRSNPYPSMATFDAPNREVCTIRRNRTNTPLQSLVTLNDPVYVEAAQSLARQMLACDGPIDAKLLLGFRHCLIRPPHDDELQLLRALYSDALTQFANDLDSAMKLATDPLGPLDRETDVREAAALTVVGNVLINLDEMFLKR